MADISVELTTDIVYVAGIVNGADTVFVQDKSYPPRWQATVDTAKDSLYHIYLEMHDEAGNKSEYESTIEYMLPYFIYDRTEDDVKRAKSLGSIGWNKMSEAEKEEWLGGLKGTFNLSDIKRSENNCYILSQLLNVPMTTCRDNPPKYPNEDYFDRLLANVTLLRNTGYHYSETPTVPEKPINTYQKLNDIERILHDVYEVYNAGFSYYAGGGLYAGETIGLLL